MLLLLNTETLQISPSCWTRMHIAGPKFTYRTHSCKRQRIKHSNCHLQSFLQGRFTRVSTVILTFSFPNHNCFRYETAEEVIMAIEELQYKPFQRTNTQAALRSMRRDVFDPNGLGRRGDRQFVPNVAIVITDGKSNILPTNTIPEAILAMDKGITILSVGIGDISDEALTELKVSTLSPVSRPPS